MFVKTKSRNRLKTAIMKNLLTLITVKTNISLGADIYTLKTRGSINKLVKK